MTEQELNKKRQQEKETIAFMIRLYCRKKHGTSTELCEKCEELLRYAGERVDKCPKMAQKTFCSTCEIHCYRKERQEQIKEVMKFSGPRMVFYHPKLAVRHMVDTLRKSNKR